MASPFAEFRSKALVAAVLSVFLAFSALLPFAATSSAQDATPEAESTVVPDLPVITITVSESSYSVNLPVPVMPGQYVVSVVNETDSLAVADLALLPEGVSFGDFSSVLFGAFQGVGGELPEWWADASFAGGSWAGPGATSQTVVNLDAGRWTVFSTSPASVQSAQNFSVLSEEEAIAAGYIEGPEESATPDASPEPSPVPVEFPVLDSAAQIEVSDSGITASGGVSGEALWQVTNAGSQPSDVVVYQVPDGTDAAGAAAIATSVAAGEAPADATLFASIGLLGPGATGYVVGNLVPGTYAVFSTAPDAAGGLQSDAGVVTILVVE